MLAESRHVAQWLERRLDMAEVGGSTPPVPTIGSAEAINRMVTLIENPIEGFFGGRCREENVANMDLYPYKKRFRGEK